MLQALSARRLLIDAYRDAMYWVSTARSQRKIPWPYPLGASNAKAWLL